MSMDAVLERTGTLQKQAAEQEVCKLSKVSKIHGVDILLGGWNAAALTLSGLQLIIICSVAGKQGGDGADGTSFFFFFTIIIFLFLRRRLNKEDSAECQALWERRAKLKPSCTTLLS